MIVTEPTPQQPTLAGPGVSGSGSAAGGAQSAAGATTPSGAGSTGATSAGRASIAGGRSSSRSSGRSITARSATTRRAPRLASLQLKRVDPWTVLKISLIVSVVMFFVWMIAIGLLYLALGGLDVWEKINVTYNTLVIAAETATEQPDLLTPGRIFGVSAVIGAINVVLFTALSAVAAFVYNAAAGMAGGVEVTLGERD